MEPAKNISNVIILNDKVLELMNRRNIDNLIDMSDKFLELKKSFEIISENIEIIKKELNIDSEIL